MLREAHLPERPSTSWRRLLEAETNHQRQRAAVRLLKDTILDAPADRAPKAWFLVPLPLPPSNGGQEWAELDYLR